MVFGSIVAVAVWAFFHWKALQEARTVKRIKGTKMRVQVDFPTGRQFIIRADVTAVKPIAKRLPEESCAFWGIKL